LVEFKYRKEKSGILGEILRPVAQLEIKSEKSNWFPIIMYIDSGADISLVPRNFGLLLGLNLTENLGQIRGIGEAIVPLSLQNVKMKIENHEIKVKIAVALINEVPYVLGRYDFFKLFKITFQEYESKVTMEKIT
jgi:predicted aspartyl protease